MIELNIIQKIRLNVFNYAPTEKKMKSGWTGELQFYVFKCPIHGIVENYPSGFNQILKCPICVKNMLS